MGTLCGHLCNNSWTDRFADLVVDLSGPKDAQVQSCLPDGANLPDDNESFMTCAEMAEPIDLPFGLWTRMGRKEHTFHRIRQMAHWFVPWRQPWTLHCFCFHFVTCYYFQYSAEARLQPNIGSTFERALTVFTRSGITPPKVNRLRWILEHCEYILEGWWPGSFSARFAQ